MRRSDKIYTVNNRNHKGFSALVYVKNPFFIGKVMVGIDRSLK